jgi:tetratricopeptide (TPR) repeat protein
LKVRNILEGSVRKSGANIRITAQLIDARTDKHLWSQTYDRVLSAENLFAIQDEIARAIVAELSSSLQLETPALDAPMVSADTGNLDAYQLFLRAREMFRQRSQDNIPVIYQMLEQAIELDPDFARAWAGLAAVSYIAPSWGVTDRDYQQRAQEAAQRALELDDSLALPYAVLGAMQTLNAPSDFVTAFEYYEQALERDSNAVNALLWRGIDLLRVGIFNAAIADFESCLVIDPAYENCRRFLALANLFLGETETALLLFEEGLAKGNTSQVDEFIFAYVDERDRRSGMLTLAWFNQAYGDDGINVETLYRALTEPGFDYSLEWQNFLADYEARTGKSSADLGRSSFYALAFRRYDDLVIQPFNMIWWNPHLTDFVASPIRKKFIRDMGVDDYWRQADFPPQCRPIGEDDFACD